MPITNTRKFLGVNNVSKFKKENLLNIKEKALPFFKKNEIELETAKLFLSRLVRIGTHRWLSFVMICPDKPIFKVYFHAKFDSEPLLRDYRISKRFISRMLRLPSNCGLVRSLYLNFYIGGFTEDRIFLFRFRDYKIRITNMLLLCEGMT